MVTPPVLNAASPVGAVTAQVVEFVVPLAHILDISVQMVLIRIDLPVPHTNDEHVQWFKLFALAHVPLMQNLVLNVGFHAFIYAQLVCIE